jgi:UDP-N-acetylmuramoyl-tripeptide--D-alanyl-D-alanine ligase
VLSTPGNFNNHIGLPLTLLTLTPAHQIAVIEMGANHEGENALLCEIATPDFGIVTNNGKDHLEGFGSLEGVKRSNAELYDYLHMINGLAFVNANDFDLMSMSSHLRNRVTYAGFENASTLSADHNGVASALRPEIVFTVPAYEEEIHSVLSGSYNFDNIMAAVCMGFHLGLSAQQVKNGIESYKPANNRSQVIHTGRNIVYLDAYNANPSSMEASLRNFAAMPFENKIAVLGDMFELGSYAEAEHANMIGICNGLELESVVLVGEEFCRQNKMPRYHCFRSTQEAMDWIRSQSFSGKNVFIKGSRGMKLELIAEALG